MIPPECCGPTDLPGKVLKSGNSAKAKLIFTPEPFALMRATLARSLASRASFGVSFSRVVLGSGLASTASASITSPLSRTTPAARPRR